MKAYLSRRYRLSASHRLHVPTYTEEQNRVVFGKCNNPYGHGHNYVVQVTVSGEVDPVTGMVVNLAELDEFAARELVERFNHQNLNTLEAFAEAVPSTENLAMEVWRIFRAFGGARLERIRIEETGNNSFDYTGGPLQYGKDDGLGATAKATAKANTGVLRFAQDDGGRQATARATAGPSTRYARSG